jgi:hypothetical protein
MKREPIDIFLWANNTDGKKFEYEIELFLFSKNYTPYSIGTSLPFDNQLPSIFLFDLIKTVNLGAGTGLSVQDMAAASDGPNVLARIDLDEVGRADTLVNLIENHYSKIVPFNFHEHDFKRLRGIVARFKHVKDGDDTFYVVKQLQPSGIVSGALAVTLDSHEIDLHRDAGSFKMPGDNQVLIVDGSVFAFNRSKFASLFNVDVKRLALIRSQAEVIDKHFRLAMPDLIGEFSFAVEGSSTNIKKLLAVDTDNLIDQEQVFEIADQMQLELMADDNGAIILMDGKDVGVFLDIINDNYVKGVTGQPYLAKSKKPLEVTDESTS